jgi:hypothetical protein
MTKKKNRLHHHWLRPLRPLQELQEHRKNRLHREALPLRLLLRYLERLEFHRRRSDQQDPSRR